VKVFYSHTFSPQHKAKVQVFREIIVEAANEIEAEFVDENGESRFRLQLVEGDRPDFSAPASAIFKDIEEADVLIAFLVDETASSQPGFVSAACLQEIVVADRAGRRVLAWIEEGCTRRSGFLPNLTKYGTFSQDDLLLKSQRDQIRQSLKERLVGLVPSSTSLTGNTLYSARFDQDGYDSIASLKWWRGYIDPEKRQVRREYPERTGGQSYLPEGGEGNDGCLLIANTQDTWNWALKRGMSITTLCRLDNTLFTRGRDMQFEVRCRSTGTIKLQPLFNGPAVDPSAPDNRETQDWNLIGSALPADWGPKTVRAEDGWITKRFRCTISYPETNVITVPVTLFLIVDTGQYVLEIDNVALMAVSD